MCRELTAEELLPPDPRPSDSRLSEAASVRAEVQVLHRLRRASASLSGSGAEDTVVESTVMEDTVLDVDSRLLEAASVRAEVQVLNGLRRASASLSSCVAEDTIMEDTVIDVDSGQRSTMPALAEETRNGCGAPIKDTHHWGPPWA